MAGPNFIANGNISPCRVVKVDTTAGKNFMVIECVTKAAIPVGVAQDGTHDAPGVTGATAYAAAANQSLKVFGREEECLLEAAGAITHGALLVVDESGSTGKVVSDANDGTTAGYLIGQALEDAAGAGVLFRAKLMLQSVKTLH